MLKSTGTVIKSKTTGAIYQNPYLAVANRAMKQMRDFLTEFGMTPSSRSRVLSSVPPMRDKKREKFFGWSITFRPHTRGTARPNRQTV